MRTNGTILLAVAVIGLGVGSASAQIPGNGITGNAAAAANANRTQAQIQQRMQAQIQARAQTQAEQRVRTQAQARLQAEAARAARLAEAAAAAAQRRATAAQPRAGGNQYGVNAGAGTQAQGTVTGQDIRAGVHAQLGLQAGLDLPSGTTAEDVAIYDKFFGRFNPLRTRSTSESQPESPPQPAPSNSKPKPATASSNKPQSPPAEHPRGRATGHLDFAARLEFAMSQRRAEISQQRDRALATGDVEMFLRAEQMEESLNAFVTAQRAARSQAEATATARPNGRIPPANVQVRPQLTAEGSVEGSVTPRTANLPEAPADGSASGTGETTLR